MIGKFWALVVLFVIVIVIFPKSTHAASLINASASATTSRPSASAPLANDAASGSTSVNIMDNGSTFLASDSATFWVNGTVESVRIATTSASRTNLVFAAATTATHNSPQGIITTAITAVHTFAFIVSTPIPSSGTIVLRYPATQSGDTNQASASATTYMFNGLTSGNIKTKVGVGAGAATLSCAPTAGTAGSAPFITCTSSGATINAGVPVWIFVGCSAIDAVPSCSTQVPTLINPTNTTARGVGNQFNVSIVTNDAGSNPLDTTTVKLNTVESVFVVAHVDPTFTFRIDGVGPSTAMNSTTTCGATFQAITTSSGTARGAQPTEVNLGTIQNATDTWEAQKMTIVSNTSAGYAITATSSGSFLNPGTGIAIPNVQGAVTANNLPVPAANNSSTGGFGIHPCDAQAYASTHVLTSWYSAASKSNPLYANPAKTFYYTLVNWTGALGNENTVTLGRDVIYSLYWAAPQANTAPGDYWEIMTYNASATF